MITKLHIENFKCLRDVTVELKPLTVLIGQNDTGKSSLLEAIDVLGAGLRNDWSDLGPFLWRDADPRVLRWEAEQSSSPGDVAPDKGTFEVGIGSNGKMANDLSGMELITGSELLATLKSAIRYQLEAKHLARPSHLWNGAEGTEPKLAPNGSGLPAVLDYLLGTNRDAFDAIEGQLHEAVPFVRRILLKPVRMNDNREVGKGLLFGLANGQEIPASLASDGVRLFLGYLTLLYSPSAPKIMLLEEPENGIHPRQLERVAHYLKRLTDPTRGSDTAQIILATHSPYFLDFVSPEAVIVFGRRPNGETVTAPLLSLPGVKERIESGFSLGEMWFNVGEDQLLVELLK